MTPTQQLCQSAGRTPAEIATEADICPKYLTQLVNKGGAGEYRADVLAGLLKCSPLVFKYGYVAYNRMAQGANETRPALEAATRRRQDNLMVSI